MIRKLIKPKQVYTHKVPKYHYELFGDDKPRGYFLIIMAVFDFWEMHPLRGELVPMLRMVSDEEKQKFKDKYVQEFPIEKLEGIAPEFHFEKGAHRSSRLVDSLTKHKKILTPLVIFQNKTSWKYGRVYEGHHRSGAAKILKWQTVPAFVLETMEKRSIGYGNMTMEDREELQQKQKSLGLPDSSRIHGTTLAYWSDYEIHQFMVPRPKNPKQYNVRNILTSKCNK